MLSNNPRGGGWGTSRKIGWGCAVRIYQCSHCFQTTPGRRVGYFQKNWVGVCSTLPETLTLFLTKICDFPYPISDLIKYLIPYFRPDPRINKRVTSCYSTYTVGVNVKREMVLSPNDEEIASSKRQTQFKTRVYKPYPISDQNGEKTMPFGAAHTYIAYIREFPPGKLHFSSNLLRCRKSIADRGGCRVVLQIQRGLKQPRRRQ